MALINKLNEIGDSIRAKTGKTELLTLDEMAEAIDGIKAETSLPEETFNFNIWEGEYAFYRGNWDWFIEKYRDKITTGGLYSCSHMFYYSKLEEIPFDINISSTQTPNFSNMFYQCNNLKSLPEIKVSTPLKVPTGGYSFANVSDIFRGCFKLREIPYDYLSSFTADGYWEAKKTTKASGTTGAFYECRSLRSLPSLLPFVNYNGTGYYSSMYNNLFLNCYALDEITDLIVEPQLYTSNVFRDTFAGCGRVKNITFETNEDGSPIAIGWKNQTIDLSVLMRNNTVFFCTGYNSGITVDKEVKDDATYQALKNDEDWFTMDMKYARYNHDSAVATINTLPDVSTGSGNVVKFTGVAGELTDGGAINTMTDAEIAVAAAKGWTVSFV